MIVNIGKQYSLSDRTLGLILSQHGFTGDEVNKYYLTQLKETKLTNLELFVKLCSYNGELHELSINFSLRILFAIGV